MNGARNSIKNNLLFWGFPWLSGKESVVQCRRHGFDPWSRRIPCCIVSLQPQLLKPPCPRAGALRQRKPPHWDACTAARGSPPTVTGKSLKKRINTSSAATNKQINISKKLFCTLSSFPDLIFYILFSLFFSELFEGHVIWFFWNSCLFY